MVSSFSLGNLINGVPDVRQPTDYSCGATSLQAVLNYYGMDIMLDKLMNMTNCTEKSTQPGSIVQGCQRIHAFIAMHRSIHACTYISISV
jgi:predicted double-glycine peptidase